MLKKALKTITLAALLGFPTGLLIAYLQTLLAN